MKKLAFTLIFFSAAFFPVLAQEMTEEVPAEAITLKKGNIPAAVLKTAEAILTESSQVQWSITPEQLKKYGLVTFADNNKPIDQYEISFRVKDGIYANAFFKPTGELIRYREVNKNPGLPVVVMKAIGKTPYKGWKVMGEKEVIMDNQNKVVEHYSVKLENGNHKKILHFTKQGDMLASR